MRAWVCACLCARGSIPRVHDRTSLRKRRCDCDTTAQAKGPPGLQLLQVGPVSTCIHASYCGGCIEGSDWLERNCATQVMLISTIEYGKYRKAIFDSTILEMPYSKRNGTEKSFWISNHRKCRPSSPSMKRSPRLHSSGSFKRRGARSGHHQKGPYDRPTNHR